MLLGGIASVVGMGFLDLSTYQHSLPIFLTAVALAGIGYSLSFLGGLNLINAKAPIHHRGATISAVLVIAYLIQGIVALLLGAAATAWGLKIAIDLGSVAIAFFGTVTVVLAILSQRNAKPVLAKAASAKLSPRVT